jgi:hypothetical protein
MPGSWRGEGHRFTHVNIDRPEDGPVSQGYLASQMGCCLSQHDTGSARFCDQDELLDVWLSLAFGETACDG